MAPNDDPLSSHGGSKDLPPDVATFLDEAVRGSLMRYDVLHFFYLNPYAILTISDLSVWMSREEKPLAEALQQLAIAGFLAQSPASSAFVLTSDRNKRRHLEAFFDYVENHPDVARQVREALRRRLEAE